MTALAWHVEFDNNSEPPEFHDLVESPHAVRRIVHVRVAAVEDSQDAGGQRRRALGHGHQRGAPGRNSLVRLKSDGAEQLFKTGEGGARLRMDHVAERTHAILTRPALVGISLADENA